MPEIHVDRLRDGDRPEWQRLFADYNGFDGRPHMEPGFYDRAWTKFIADARMHARVARVDGALRGIVHFLTHPSTVAADVCYLQDLFTDPAARGLGVATALIAEVERWARERGCSRVYWVTAEANEPARRLYDRVAAFRGLIRYQIDF